MERKIRETESLNSQVSREFMDDFKALAARHERSVAAELRVAVRHWLAKHTDDEAKGAA